MPAGKPRHALCVRQRARRTPGERQRRATLVETEVELKRERVRRSGTLAAIASFALGDYEWLLAFEADELHRIVDLMRELRASRARNHVREEVPFFTGPKVAPKELVANLR